MNEHRPIGTGFFPWARIGVSVGLAVGICGLLLRAEQPPLMGAASVVAAQPAPVERQGGPPPAVAPPSDEWPQGHLYGPQTTWPVPLRGPLLVHVWLEGCRDCMPAFEAHKRLTDTGALDGLAYINVAYGRATPEFAKQWRVDDRLVFDGDGSVVVRPFGISSFTTLVIDRRGNEVLRARPDEAGYVERVRHAYQVAMAPK